MKTTRILLIFVFLFVFQTNFGQEAHAQVREKPFITIHSVNIFTGYYNPTMKYWDKTYLPSQGVDDKFGGNVPIGFNVAFQLPEEFRVRVGYSYWQDKVEDDNASLEKLRIGFNRFRLGALYVPERFSFADFQPYGGLEGQFYLIKNKATQNGESLTMSGQNYSFAPLIGLEYCWRFRNNKFRHWGDFITAFEFQYNIGKYKQDVDEGLSIEKEKVSIAGPELLLSIGYKF